MFSCIFLLYSCFLRLFFTPQYNLSRLRAHCRTTAKKSIVVTIVIHYLFVLLQNDGSTNRMSNGLLKKVQIKKDIDISTEFYVGDLPEVSKLYINSWWERRLKKKYWTTTSTQAVPERCDVNSAPTIHERQQRLHAGACWNNSGRLGLWLNNGGWLAVWGSCKEVPRWIRLLLKEFPSGDAQR